MLPDGTLVKSRSRNDIYLIEGGKRRHITSAKLFQSSAIRWRRSVLFPIASFWGMQKEKRSRFRTAHCLCLKKTKKIYLIKEGGKRHIISSESIQSE